MKIVCSDALGALKKLPDGSVHCCVTSPPYYALRDYGVEGQIGLEKTPCDYIQKLVAIFREVKRVLRDDGTLWVNIGDGYAGSGKGAWLNKKVQKEVYIPDPDSPQCKVPKTWRGIKAKDLIGIPWTLAFALRDDGWYLRQDLVWYKPNAMPEPVKDRCTKSHEYIFLLSKSPKYYFDSNATKEMAVQKDRVRNDRIGVNKEGIYNPGNRIFTGSETRNKRDVWIVNTKPHKGAHFAVFPEKLILPCILSGVPENGVVLDPFMGSGTVGVVAIKNKRDFIGVDINPAYVKMAKKRIKDVL